MSVDEPTFQALLGMGIEVQVARKAATMFTKADAAVEWCFGDGLGWTPERDRAPPKRPVPPTPDFAKPGTTVEHHEVAASTAPDLDWAPTVENSNKPRLPPRTTEWDDVPRLNEPKPFGDKNPFRQAAPTPVNPFHVREETWNSGVTDLTNDTDDNEELQKALALSLANDDKMDVDTPVEEDDRTRRERSVRATAPPPSPTPDNVKNETQGDGQGVTFGPSQQTDPDGKMAMVPRTATMNDLPSRSKEDEDLDKAIADSLMTASFHSAASAPHDDSLPAKTKRDDLAPLVLYSASGQHTGTANLFQAVLQIPRFTEYLEKRYDRAYCADLIGEIHVVMDEQRNITDSFYPADAFIRNFKGENARRDELPPWGPVKASWERLVNYLRKDANDASSDELANSNQDSSNFSQIFESRIKDPNQSATHVQIWRDQKISNVYDCLAQALWTESPDGPSSIQESSDILAMFIGWQPSAKRELLKLDQKLVLDRFMSKHQAWATQSRAVESMAAGDARRAQEAIDKLTKYNDNDIETSIKATIKHYETYPGEDDMDRDIRATMKEKLQTMLGKLQAKVETHREQLRVKEELISGGVFKTDDPSKNEHVYGLRAVLFHDGALMGTRHLYMYLLCDGPDDTKQWWKIKEHEATKVAWDAVAGDATGIYMDGGPYCLLYDRESPRVEPYGAALPQATQEQPGTAVPASQASSVTLHASDSGVQHIEDASEKDLAPHSQVGASAAAEQAQIPDLLGDRTPSPPLQSQRPLVDLTSNPPVVPPRPLPQVPRTSHVEPEKKEPEDHIMS